MPTTITGSSISTANINLGGTFVSDKFASNTYLQSQLGGSFRNGEVIEEYYLIPDGRQITTVGGTANTEAVTSTQSINSTTQTKITGSELTGYVVPSGTKFVHYKYQITNFSRAGANVVESQIYLFYKINGGAYNQTQAHYFLTEDHSSAANPVTFNFTFEVGAASANVQLGQMTETTPKLDFKIELRARQSNQGPKMNDVHTSEPWGSPTTPGSYSPPFIGIKATAG